MQNFTDNLAPNLTPAQALQLLITRHGMLRVVLALPKALWRQRERSLLLQRPVSYHIARDIGLSYEPPRKDPWEFR